jgi:predicted nuclease of predicted toxin-antitoxin system
MIPLPAEWQFLVDENLPQSLAADLVALGARAVHVLDLGMRGAKDPAVWAEAQSRRLTILTGDKDFANIRAYPPPHAGIIVVEVPDTLPPTERKILILRELRMLVGYAFANLLVILEPGRYRIRQ